MCVCECSNQCRCFKVRGKVYKMRCTVNISRSLLQSFHSKTFFSGSFEAFLPLISLRQTWKFISKGSFNEANFMFIKANFMENAVGWKRKTLGYFPMIYRKRKNKFKTHFIVKRWNMRKGKWIFFSSFFFMFFTFDVERGSRDGTFFLFNKRVPRPFPFFSFEIQMDFW